MQHSGFFDAAISDGVYDRVYASTDFANYFASFIGNGVFAKSSNQLQVIEQNPQSMNVLVRSGQAWINGYWYENTDNLALKIDPADGVLNRIDSIVLRKGILERSIELAVKKGTPAVTAVAPTVARSVDYYELKLADILVPAGTINIKQEKIVDKRLDSTVCGFVAGLIEQFDTTHFSDQLQSFIDNLKITSLQDVQNALDELNEFINADAAGNIVKRLNALENLKFVTLNVADWVGATAPYTQTVALQGVKSYMTATLVSNLSPDASVGEQKEYIKNYGIVSSGYANIEDNAVTFKVYKKPTSSISVGLKGITGVNDIIVDSQDALFNAYDLYFTIEQRRMTFRGKNLGTSFTAAQKTNIQNGTFKGFFLGDYWLIGGVTWRIVDIDYWYNLGGTAFTKHHLVIMPDSTLYTARMNSTNTTDGGYLGSEMYTTGLTQAKTTITGIFGDAVLTHKETMIDGVTNGVPTSNKNVDSSIELPSEAMIYGHSQYGPPTGLSLPINGGALGVVSKQQLALFMIAPRFTVYRSASYLLRDTFGPTCFAMAHATGASSYSAANSITEGVRPVFAIG